ncbi:MAG: hypothetical protein AB4063_07815 [Crocosphaera sp.]
MSKVQFNLWAYKPDVEEWTNERRQEWQLEQQRKRSLKEQQEREQLKKLLPIPERDKVIRTILEQLTLSDAHRQRLKTRGLTDTQIDEAGYRSVSQWQKLTNPVNNRLSVVNIRGDKLNNFTDGILIPIANEDGLYTALRVNNLEAATNGHGKYVWVSSAKRGIKVNLPNGELPITVYFPDKPSQTNKIGLCEGLEYKPLLAAKNLGIPVIGFPGSNFSISPKTLKALIKKIWTEWICTNSDTTSNGTLNDTDYTEQCEIILIADAGVGVNPQISTSHISTMKMIEGWGYDIKLADWGQLNDKENGLDIDEIELNTTEINLISLQDFKDKSKYNKPHKYAYYSLEPDPIAYQEYVEWQSEQEEIEEAIYTERKIYQFKDFLSKGLKKLAKKKAKKLSKINPFGEGESYTGNRAKKLLKEIRNGFDVRDNTFMGDGTTHSVLDLLDLLEIDNDDLQRNSIETVIYLSKNHRNPSLPEIKRDFTDINPRTQWGFYLNNEGLLVEASELINPDSLVTKPNCIRGDMFKGLTNKGYDIENSGDTINPICLNCPLLSKCSDTPGMYKHDKRKQTEAKYQRGFPDSFPRDKDYSKHLLIFDEPSEQLSTTQEIIESWEQIIIELDRLRPYLTSQQPSPLKQQETIISNSQQPNTLNEKETIISNSQQPNTLNEKGAEVKTEDNYQFIDRLVQQLKPLFKNKKSLDIPSDKRGQSLKYGLEHEIILGLISVEDKEKLSQIVAQLEFLESEFICELMGKLDRDHLLGVEQFDHEKEYQELKKQLSSSLPITERNQLSIRFNYLDEERNEFKKKIKMANSYHNSQKNTDYVKEISQKITDLPPNGLINILKALLGDTKISLRITGNQCHIVVNDPNKYEFISDAKKIYLETTIDSNHLQKLMPSSRPLKVVHREIPLPLENLELTNINTPGLKTNNPTKTATNRSQKVLRELTNRYGDMALITHKGDIMDKDGYYFRDNIGSNKFEGNPNLAFKGTPNPNYGAIMDEYRAIYGNLDGFEAYYDRLIKAQILQGVGRQRCQRYPEQKFRLFMIATDLDLDFLKDYGCKISNHYSLEYHPEAGDPTQVARLETLSAIADLSARGTKITLQAIGDLRDVSREAVRKLIKKSGLTLAKLIRFMQKILSTGSIDNLIEGVDRNFEVKQLRQFLELEFEAIATETLADIKAMGWELFEKTYLQTFPEPVLARITAVLLALIDEERIIFDSSPPP